MRRIRVIPTLLIAIEGLVKTVRFGKRTYLGDPINAVKIFNEKEVDELVVMDIDAGKPGGKINFSGIEDIVSEAFMPVAYGGGISGIDDIKRLLAGGVEKVILSAAAHKNPGLLETAASMFGSQSVVASVDVKKGLFGKQQAMVSNGKVKTGRDPVAHALHCVAHGAGELIVMSIDREGTYGGYDCDLLSAVSSEVKVPVVANGGAASVDDFLSAVRIGGCSAVAAGSMFVYSARGEGVLINYPKQEILAKEFWAKLD
jgi:cyclase